jgi:cell division septation protein DedD
MNIGPTIACLLWAASLIAGCGTTEELPPAAPSTQQQAEPPKMRFETETDTVDTFRAVESPTPVHTEREDLIRFMVQIGAFKDPEHASIVQVRARERYRMPVLNDYHTKLGLYQIRIGFFESRDTAIAFLKKMQIDYFEDYKDSWIVQLKR